MSKVIMPYWYSNKKDILWIKITPKIIKRQCSYTSNQSATYKTQRSSRPDYYFIAPKETEENSSHNWEPLDNLITKLAGLEKNVRNMVSGMSTSVLNTYLMYLESPRREMSFTFNFSIRSRDDAKSIMEHVRNFQIMASPNYVGMDSYVSSTLQTNNPLLEVDPPYVFRISSVAGNTMKEMGSLSPFLVENAALTSVQPTFKAPYLDGYPSQIDLTLTFKDVDILSGMSFSSGQNKVTTSFKDGGTSLANKAFTEGKRVAKKGIKVVQKNLSDMTGGLL